MDSQPFDPDVAVWWRNMFPKANSIVPFNTINDCVLVRYNNVHLKIYDGSNGLHKVQMWEHSTTVPILEANLTDGKMSMLGRVLYPGISVDEASSYMTRLMITDKHDTYCNC